MVLYVYSCTGMNMWAQVAPEARRGIRSFGAGLQVVESHLAWLLGTKVQSSATDMSLAPCLTFKEKIIAQFSNRKEKAYQSLYFWEHKSVAD